MLVLRIFACKHGTNCQTWCFPTPFTNKHSWWNHHWQRCTQKVVLFLVSIGISSALSFLFKSPLLSGICTSKRQTHCPSGRPVRDQAGIFRAFFGRFSWQFSGRFPDNFPDDIPEHQTLQIKGYGDFLLFSGRFSGRPPGAFSGALPDEFPGIFRANFRKVVRILEQTWSGTIEVVGAITSKGML